MNSILPCFKSLNTFFLPIFPLAALLWLAPVVPVDAASTGRTFASPEDAVHAFTIAINNHDSNSLAAIFGPTFEEIESPDPVQAKNELESFTQSLNKSKYIEHVAKDRCILDIGDDRLPFAIPIVQKGGVWFFDTDSGKDELIKRRIGRNELDVLKSVRAYADAQREYASKDRNGDQVLQYAQKILSSPGTKDGLYWSPDTDPEISPLGPLYAEAQSEGYFKKPQTAEEHPPFHGYFFKILTRQGTHAPGGAYDYIINGRMIAGFALIAWPSDYRDSGIMTFIINQQGQVYQKDLGKGTESIVGKMKDYDPDSSWTPSPD